MKPTVPSFRHGIDKAYDSLSPEKLAEYVVNQDLQLFKGASELADRYDDKWEIEAYIRQHIDSRSRRQREKCSVAGFDKLVSELQGVFFRDKLGLLWFIDNLLTCTLGYLDLYWLRGIERCPDDEKEMPSFSELQGIIGDSIDRFREFKGLVTEQMAEIVYSPIWVEGEGPPLEILGDEQSDHETLFEKRRRFKMTMEEYPITPFYKELLTNGGIKPEFLKRIEDYEKLFF